MPLLQLPLGHKRDVIRNRIGRSDSFVVLDFGDTRPATLGRQVPDPVVIEEGLTVGQLLKVADICKAEAEKRDKRQNKRKRQT